ncbi:hypothetical protein Vadar_024188 [Vaccinium darrowii]|uniref:Uncharacterized protein n=1 Tax=Vaccinium darrowii TaxID=229202 RepID=A0ACB7XT55_9ERIC|nr:hypothetical protein Vadar_024188 [Vaccinium darrowii]
MFSHMVGRGPLPYIDINLTCPSDRGKIPFFVSPPKEEDGSLKDEPKEPGVDKDNAVDEDKASAALRGIANFDEDNAIQKHLCDENELKGEISDQLPSTES